MWRQLLILALLFAAAQAACKGVGCTTCTTSIVSGTYVQLCEQCATGYLLISNACTFDVGLVTGVSIAALIVTIVQISCFCFCRAYFKHMHKRNIQFTLQDIFETLEEERNDKFQLDTLKATYSPFHNESTKCFFCEQYPNEVPQFKELKKRIAEKEKRDKQKQNNPSQGSSNDVIEGSSEDDDNQLPPNPFGPTLRLKCTQGHYYHLQCIQKHLLRNDEKECICKNHEITPFYMICIECKLKHRMLKLELNNTNIKQIQDYVCSICYRKIREREDRKKWWKKIL